MNYLKKAAFVLPATIIFLALFFYFGFSRPKDFSSPKFIRIEKGSSLLMTGEKLKQEGVIRSRAVFVTLEKIANAEKVVKAGDYLFERPTSVFNVVIRLANGDFGIEQKKITVPEGSTIIDIADAMKGFSVFNKEEFLTSAKDKEGYLFPDTYFLFADVSEEGLMKAMEDNFDVKIKTVDADIKRSGKTLNEVVTMASIIEKEVATQEDRAIVSGILWKRISRGMPLQVDATLGYITGKTSAQLTLDDLKIKSSYNTYLNKGLPPAPICNPGLDTIKAALSPKDSPYFFYLTGRDGKTYFAKTFDEHKNNKAKYLR